MWTVGERDISYDGMTPHSTIWCTTYSRESVLQIQNTTFLGQGKHQVQCVIQHNIPDKFVSDESYSAEDNFTPMAILEIFRGNCT